MLTKVSGGLGLQLRRVQLLGLPPALLIPSRRDQKQSRFGADELQELFYAHSFRASGVGSSMRMQGLGRKGRAER